MAVLKFQFRESGVQRNKKHKQEYSGHSMQLFDGTIIGEKKGGYEFHTRKIQVQG